MFVFVKPVGLIKNALYCDVDFNVSFWKWTRKERLWPNRDEFGCHVDKGLVVVASFMSTSHKLKWSESRKTQLRKRLLKMHYKIFFKLVIHGRLPSSLWLGPFWPVGPGSISKLTSYQVIGVQTSNQYSSITSASAPVSRFQVFKFLSWLPSLMDYDVDI